MINDFSSATKATIHFLRERFGFDLWMVTRTEGNDWIVLDVENEHYGVKPGAVFKWSDSFCSRMVMGLGPRIAPRASEIDVYAESPIAQAIQIGAYVGMPITRADGSLFGTLCAIDPQPQSDQIKESQPMIELLADMLSSMLNTELSLADTRRRAEHAEAEATRDALTSLYNRRGWDQLLEREEDRCRRYGNPACVVSIDLDDLKIVNDTLGHGAGDELLLKASNVMRDAVRSNDVIARLGGDEFAVLGVECDVTAASALVERLQKHFAQHGVRASIGHASRHPEHGLHHAFKEADDKMYMQKKSNRQRSTSMMGTSARN